MGAQTIKDTTVLVLGHVRGDNPSEEILPPKGELCFRKIKKLSGGTTGFVFEDNYGDTVTIAPEEFEDFNGETYKMTKILPATDCQFLVFY